MKISLISGQSGNEVRVDFSLRETQREFKRTESGSEFPDFAIGSVLWLEPENDAALVGTWEVYRRIVFSGQGFRVLLRRHQPNG